VVNTEVTEGRREGGKGREGKGREGKGKGNRGDGVEVGRVGRAVIWAVKYRPRHQDTAIRPNRKFNGG